MLANTLLFEDRPIREFQETATTVAATPSPPKIPVKWDSRGCVMEHPFELNMSPRAPSLPSPGFALKRLLHQHSGFRTVPPATKSKTMNRRHDVAAQGRQGVICVSYRVGHHWNLSQSRPGLFFVPDSLSSGEA